MKTTKAEERAKKVEQAIRLAYGSLETHLRYTHGKLVTHDRNETHAFHKRCVTEYATLIKLLTELY